MARSHQRRRDPGPDPRVNGDVRMKDHKHRSCPVDDVVLLFGLVVAMAVAVPFFAKTIPNAHRTDILWWMGGVVYQVPPPTDQDSKYFKVIKSQLQDLSSLGVDSLRLGNFFPLDEEGSPIDYYQPNPIYGDLDQFDFFINELDILGIKLIVDLPLVYTSKAHIWFWEDRKQKAENTAYIWSEIPINDDTDRGFFTNLWEKDNTTEQYYQYRPPNNNSALFNYAHSNIRHKIGHVLEHWIRRGVDGFVFLEYDTIKLRNSTDGDNINHIETDDPFVKKINNLANVTRSFRELFDYYEEEYEGTIFFGVDLTTTDDKIWHAIHEAGADLILNHELEMSEADLTQGNLNPFYLRNQVKKAMSRIPEDYYSNWKVCSLGNSIEVPENNNTAELLNLIHLLMPGAAFLCPGQLPKVLERNNISTRNFQEVVKWREAPAMSWGAVETTLVDNQIFSFARFAYGKMYDRFVVITNFGTSPQHRNFTLTTKKLKIPDIGIVKYSTCASSENNLRIESVLFLNETFIQPRCGILVKLLLKPFI